MQLGNFSLSLKVDDLRKSIEFYQCLGFVQSSGKIEHNYVIMRNQTTVIGLYQGHIEQNMLTFNPKWDSDCNPVDGDDIRAIHQTIRDNDLPVEQLNNDEEDGPNHFYITDPDGNLILFDQHI